MFSPKATAYRVVDSALPPADVLRELEQKAAELTGRIFPQPPLVWRVDGGDLKIRALMENKRPTPETKLAVAPFWNLSDDGRVCVRHHAPSG